MGLQWVLSDATHWLTTTKYHEIGPQQMVCLLRAQVAVGSTASELLVSVGHEIAFAVDDDRGAFNPFGAVF